MFKVSPIAQAVMLACVTVSPSIFAQQQPAQKLERVEITGSNIKRVQADGPLPVEVITREEIRRKGVTSVNELIRTLTYMSSFNDELTANSPNVSGTASVGFRGLGGDQTVVLLNGRRLANYGFDGSFVNINTIPIGAIERVDILKDGAAAIYGADAIGGVINFITRRDYRGFELTSGYGKSSRNDADETSLSANAGFGDLDADKFNVLVNLNYFKREAIWNLDRERTRTADYRRFGGTSLMSESAPTGNLNRAPFLPCPSADLILPSGACGFDFAPYRTTLYPTERIGGLLSANYRLNDNTTLFAEAMVNQTSSFLSAAPAPGNITLPADSKLNSTASAITVASRPMQSGPRTTDQQSEANRVLLGAKGTWSDLEYDFALGRASNTAENHDGGYLVSDQMVAAINSGKFNPYVTTNDQALVNSLIAKDVRHGKTTYSFIDGKLSGELTQLPAGPMGYAVGGIYGKDEIADVPGPNQQKRGPFPRQSNVFGSIIQSPVVAERKMGAIYSELSIPVASNLEAQLALRHDRYSGGTQSTTPKIAVSYKPLSVLAWKASFSEGFKMPSLRDLFGGTNQSADSVLDSVGCKGRKEDSCANRQFDRFSGGNSALKPEESKSINLGMVFEPNAVFSLGADYFAINKTNEIGLVDAQSVVNRTPYAPGATATVEGNPLLSVTRDAKGVITAINTMLDNLGQRKIRGIDLNSTLRIPLDQGPRLVFNGYLSMFTRYDRADLPGDSLVGRLGLLNLPRWRSVASATAEWIDWTATLTQNNMAKMQDKSQANAASKTEIQEQRILGHFETYDLSVSYRGIKNLKLNAGIKNLLDAEPPFSNQDPRSYGFAQVHDIRGRFYQVSANYQF